MSRKKWIAGVAVVIAGFVVAYQVLSRTTTDVEIERTFEAPIDKVWSTWNDSDSIKRYWSPKDYTAPVVLNEFKEGGFYLFAMQAPNGTMTWNKGQYLKIVPQQQIVSTMSFSDKNGVIIPASEIGLPGHWPQEVKMTVDFSDLGGKTHVKVRQSGIPKIMSVFAKMGWDQQFDKFETLIK
jgi:uncharacterized protein YndB with AHSA1/START domain